MINQPTNFNSSLAGADMNPQLTRSPSHPKYDNIFTPREQSGKYAIDLHLPK